MSFEITAPRAEEFLVAHQRHSISHCLCGRSELGRSHAGHQVEMLRRAGLLLPEPRDVSATPET